MNWESYAHPISDVRDWSNNQRLELQPDFQRNEVWTQSAQIMLIDTIIKGIPIPKIYIKSIIRDQNTYRVVIDGQQRLTAILKFIKNQLRLKKPFDSNSPYFNKLFKELDEQVQNSILRYKIDINEISNPTDDEIRDLYSRVNKYTVQLNKQELRKADFPGEFIRCAEELSEGSFFEQANIFTVKQRRRMLDVEFIEELLTIIIHGIQDKKDYIDEMCEKYMSLGEQKQEYLDRFYNTVTTINNILPASALAKTRFSQKADFYSLFSALNTLHQQGKKMRNDKVEEARHQLLELNEKIQPHSEDDDFRNYAIMCISDANSYNSRKWREEYLISKIDNCFQAVNQ